MGYFRKDVEQAEAYEPGFQPKDTDVIKLNTNENPYPPSPEVMKVFSQVGAEQLRRYPDPKGTAFREAAAEVHGLRAENILCCNGGDELLRMAIQAFCDKQQAVAWPVPTYSLYKVLADLHGCRIIEIPFDSGFKLPVSLTTMGATLTIVCNPNAPSGSFVSVDELASLANRSSGVLLIDEAYVDFAEDNCVSLVRSLDNVLLLRSMSKGYSLAGMRFGYAIAQSDLISGLMKVKDSYNVDAVAIAAATAAIRDQGHFRENVEKIEQGRELLTSQLEELGFKVPKSSANFVLAESKNVPAGIIYDKLVQRKIYVRYFDSPGLKDKLRITVGTSQQNEQLISALRQMLSN
jgi:histidinol-phosphate aminotransferase